MSIVVNNKISMGVIMKRNKKKNIMIIVLCFVLLLMGVGYAVVSQRLTIGGTAKMQGVWDVRITNIQLSRKTGLAKDNSHKYENLSASFQTETLAPGDMLEYTVSVSNKGNIDALVSEINATLDGPEAIKYTVEGIKKGDIIKEGATKEVIITIKFDENATVIPTNKTSTLNINFTCIQNTQSIPTENLTVYKTRMKKAENSPSETTNFFDGPIARNKIKKITFYDTLNVEGYSNNFDISEDSSGKVLAWYKTDSNGYYELAIGQDGGVIANPNMVRYFQFLTALEEINLEKLDTFGVTNMQNMFENCKNLKELDLSSFDTKSVYNMANMFLNCSNVKSINLKSFRTPSLTVIPNMFSGCSSLVELDLTNFDTSKATNFANMFLNCKSLVKLNLTGFKTTSATNLINMFKGCSSLEELDVTSFNTSKVKTMASLFYGCTSLKSIDLSKFDTSNVVDIGGMFYNCQSLVSLDLSSFNTSNVTNMGDTFNWCISLKNINLSSFNTSKVTTISSLFYKCESLETVDLSNFNTSNVTNMDKVFMLCTNLTTIYVSELWNTSKVTTSTFMFNESSKLKGSNGTVSYSWDKVDVSMANYTTGYLTYKKTN